MEDVGGGGVVHNDDVSELPAQAAEVFDIVAPVEKTGLSEQARPEYAPLVQQVGDRIRVLHTGQRRASGGQRQNKDATARK